MNTAMELLFSLGLAPMPGSSKEMSKLVKLESIYPFPCHFL